MADLLVFKFFHGQGLVLLMADAVEQMLTMMSEQLTDLEKLVKDYKSPKAASRKEGAIK